MSDPWQQPQQQPQQSGDWQQPQQPQQPQQSGGGWQQPQPSGDWQQPQQPQESGGWQQPQPTQPMQSDWQQGQQSGDWQQQQQQQSGDWQGQQSGDWQQQQQFGAQPYGAYGQPGYGYSGPPQSNGMAIAGLILAFLCWPVGLVLSIIGFNKSKQLGGAGRGQALAGMIISPIVGVGGILIAVALFATASTVADNAQKQLNTINSQLASEEASASSAASAAQNNQPTDANPADDPGCTSIETSAAALNGEMSNNVNNASEAISYLQTFDDDVITAEGESNNTQVSDDLDSLDTDITSVIDDFEDIEDGVTSDTTQLDSDISTMETAADTIDTLCG